MQFKQNIIEFPDPDGQIEFYFSLFDCSKNINEINEIFKQKYNTSDHELEDYFKTITDLNIVEYVFESEFTDSENIRLSRNFDFYGCLTNYKTNKYNIQKKFLKVTFAY